MARCENDHDVPEGQAFCGRCGLAVPSHDESSGVNADEAVDPGEDQPPASSNKRQMRVWWIAAALAVVLLGGIALVLLTKGGDGSEPGAGGGATGHLPWVIECPGRAAGIPEGTDLVSIAVEKNDPDEIVLSAKFDGPIPPYDGDLEDGDVQATVQWFLYPEDRADNDSPYSVNVTTLFGGFTVDGARVGAGFVDSSGYELEVDGDEFRVTFDPASMVDLEGGTRWAFAATTLVTEYQQTSTSFGNETLDEETC